MLRLPRCVWKGQNLLISVDDGYQKQNQPKLISLTFSTLLTNVFKLVPDNRCVTNYFLWCQIKIKVLFLPCRGIPHLMMNIHSYFLSLQHLILNTVNKCTSRLKLLSWRAKSNQLQEIIYREISVTVSWRPDWNINNTTWICTIIPNERSTLDPCRYVFWWDNCHHTGGVII